MLWAFTKTPSVVYHNFLREFLCTAIAYDPNPPADIFEIYYVSHTAPKGREAKLGQKFLKSHSYWIAFGWFWRKYTWTWLNWRRKARLRLYTKVLLKILYSAGDGVAIPRDIVILQARCHDHSQRLRSDAVVSVVTSSLVRYDDISRNCDAVSRHCTEFFKRLWCRVVITVNDLSYVNLCPCEETMGYELLNGIHLLSRGVITAEDLNNKCEQNPLSHRKSGFQDRNRSTNIDYLCLMISGLVELYKGDLGYQGMDKSKITRKQSKASKHEHENQKEYKAKTKIPKP
ncbi:hypothetical protein Tco_1043568 [Tanacetum coccineum]|uniref:Uncharacterized protein n=1 Tax=Tanacetum coccineum TaxID=301880 RepID=A0ABQ5GME7_9ASTR